MLGDCRWMLKKSVSMLLTRSAPWWSLRRGCRERMSSSSSVEGEFVCDHSYKVELTDQEQEVCVDLETIDCIQKNITVTDTDSVEGVEFNCQKDVSMEKRG